MSSNLRRRLLLTSAFSLLLISASAQPLNQAVIAPVAGSVQPTGVIGTNGSNSNITLIPTGTGGIMVGPVPDGTTVGGNARGAMAVDLQFVRSFAVMVASGIGSFVAGGYNVASGNNSVALGQYNVAGNQGSVALGLGVNVTGTGSVGTGYAATDRGRYATSVTASGDFAVSGDAQSASQIQRVSTVTTTPARMTADMMAAGSANIFNTVANTSYSFTILLVGRDVTTAGLVTVSWSHGILTEGATAGTEIYTNIVTPTTLYTGTAVGMSLSNFSLTADTTNGGLNLTVTPPNTDTWHWVAKITSIEVM